jgi:AbiV family abortive infection protein
MKFNKIKNLSNLEIVNGLELCYINSNELFESALILKKNKNFGISISLMILSIEELV